MQLFFKKTKNFVLGIAQDERLPSRDKKLIALMIVLIISPIDFIPDWYKDIGLIDDFIILSILFDYFFFVLDSRLLLSHYSWTMKSFARFRSIAHFMQFLVPKFIKRNLWLYIGDPY